MESNDRSPRGGAVFAVSKVRLDGDGRVSDVYWGEVDTKANDWAAPEHAAPVAQVVEVLNRGSQVFALFPSEHGHLPDRRFRVIHNDNGIETIAFDGPPTFEREVHDMERFED